ncbi:hypothetical protein C0995_012427, partial [Termitomyces sp. Mi166
HQRRNLAPISGALPTTPPPSDTPWTDFRMPKKEPSPMTSKAETSAILAPSPPPSLSEDDFTPSHQNNPEPKLRSTHHT